jgi:hypothetical protein
LSPEFGPEFGPKRDFFKKNLQKSTLALKNAPNFW